MNVHTRPELQYFTARPVVTSYMRIRYEFDVEPTFWFAVAVSVKDCPVENVVLSLANVTDHACLVSAISLLTRLPTRASYARAGPVRKGTVVSTQVVPVEHDFTVRPVDLSTMAITEALGDTLVFVVAVRVTDCPTAKVMALASRTIDVGAAGGSVAKTGVSTSRAIGTMSPRSRANTAIPAAVILVDLDALCSASLPKNPRNATMPHLPLDEKTRAPNLSRARL